MLLCRFPKDETLRKRWIIAVKRKNFVPNDKSSKICSEHFVESDYLVRPNINLPQLKPDAVPSVFKGFPEHLIPKPKKPRSSSVIDKLERRSKVQECEPSTSTLSLPNVPDEHMFSASEAPVSPIENTESRSIEVQTNDIEMKSKIIQTDVSTTQDSIVHSLETKISAQVRKIRTLQQKIRRQKRKIYNLKGLLSILKSEGFLDTASVEILSEQFTGITREIFQNEVKNISKQPKGRRYSDEVKKFALTLHYHSPKAYEYCRLVSGWFHN